VQLKPAYLAYVSDGYVDTPITPCDDIAVDAAIGLETRGDELHVDFLE